MNKNDNRRHIMMRYGVIIFFILLFAVSIVAKLIDTTVITAEEWNKKANEELSRVDTILPVRGNILAADGSILATNLRYYTIRLDYRCEKFREDRLRLAADSLADSLASRFKHIHSSKEWKDLLLDPLKTDPKKRPRAKRLLSQLSFADVEWIKTLPFFNINNRNKTGLTVESYMRRANPYGDMAHRSIGIVGQDSLSNEVRGRSGLEKALDTLLYGKIGFAKRIPLTKGIVNWTDVPARQGYDIRTTIDINIQDIVENELNNELEYCDADWGVAILMDVKTGDIKAISNLEKNPKANNYIEGQNRAVLRFEPGSVVKTLSMLIALEDGIVSGPDEVISTGHSWAYAGGRPITDSHSVESLTVGEVIERSSNIGMSKIIARKYDRNPGGFYNRVKRLGFLEPLNTGIAGECTPRIDSVPSTTAGRIAMSRQSYGYATEIPPIYTLALYNAIANGGRFVRPRLVSALISNGVDSVLPVSYIRDRICSETNAARLRTMLKNVVWGNHGTGKLLRNDLVKIAGKTGTCYMIEEATKQYNQSKKRLTFCGFFPADNPRYSCIVLTCNPKQNAFGAASTSGQALKNIALKLYSRGLLGNESDYRRIANPGTRPTFFATGETDSQNNLRKELSITQSSVIRSNRTAAKGIPDVTGYGFREAIAILERAGYNVRFTGNGYVSSQSPAAGTKSRTGTVVTLSLHP